MANNFHIMSLAQGILILSVIKLSITDFPAMVDTIGNLDKSVQYYHMLEEQLRLYREELEKIWNRIDGVDDITKFKAVNYEGSYKYDLQVIHLQQECIPVGCVPAAR